MTRASRYPTASFFKGLKTLLASLPTEEEKVELILTLREARSFLEELQQLVEDFPTTESSRGLSEGLSRLDIIAGRASGDAPLRKLMGLKVSPLSKGRKANGSGDAAERARRLEQSLNDPEVSNVEEWIARSGEPISVLTELAASLGLRKRNKERKLDLVKRIVTHIENQRGYRILRGGDAESAVSTATAQPEYPL